MRTKKEEMVDLFCQQCWQLRRIYDDHCELYAHGDLLKEAAAQFFFDLNYILLQHVLLGMCKLTDPPTSCGNKENLTVKRILELVGPDLSDPRCLTELSVKIHQIRPSILRARNKIIAHFDQPTAHSGQRLGATSKDDRDAFWKAVDQFVDITHEHYFHERFPRPVRNQGAAQLVNWLEEARVSYNRSTQEAKERARASIR